MNQSEFKQAFEKTGKKVVLELIDALQTLCHHKSAARDVMKHEAYGEVMKSSSLQEKEIPAEEINLYTQVFDERRSAVQDTSNRKKEKVRLLEAINSEISSQNQVNLQLKTEISELEKKIEEAKSKLASVSRTQVKLELERDFNRVKIAELANISSKNHLAKEDGKRHSLPLNNDLRGYTSTKEVEARRSIENKPGNSIALTVPSQPRIHLEKHLQKTYEMNTTQKKLFSGIKGNFAESMPLIYQDSSNYEVSTNEALWNLDNDNRMLSHGFTKQKITGFEPQVQKQDNLKPDYFPSQVPALRFIGSPQSNGQPVDKRTLFLTSSISKMQAEVEGKNHSRTSSRSKLQTKKSIKEFSSRSHRIESTKNRGASNLDELLVSKRVVGILGNGQRARKFNQISQDVASMIAHSQSKRENQGVRETKDRLKELYSDMNEISSQSKSGIHSNDNQKVNSYGLLPYCKNSARNLRGDLQSKLSRREPLTQKADPRTAGMTIYSGEDAVYDCMTSPYPSDRPSRRLNKESMTNKRVLKSCFDDLGTDLNTFMEVINKNLPNRESKALSISKQYSSASKNAGESTPE